MGILIIDEPENHLHESLLWNFVLLLKNIANERTNGMTLSQVFLLTHSKTLIYNNFSDGKNFVIEEKTVKELQYENCESILRSIGVSCINEKILFVEGITDQKLLQDLLSEYNIRVNILGNCSLLIKAYEGIQTVSDKVQDKQFVFLIDKDTRDEEEIELLRQENSDYFDKHVLILDREEIENYLLDPKKICDAYNDIAVVLDKEHKDVSGIEEQIKKHATNCFETTKKKYLNHLLHVKLTHIDSLIKQRDIVLDSEIKYEGFIDSIFSSEEWKNIQDDMKKTYSLMEKKYSSENWGKNWKSLCDGKQVFNNYLSELSDEIGIKKPTMKDKIIRCILEDDKSDLSLLIKKVISMFGI